MTSQAPQSSSPRWGLRHRLPWPRGLHTHLSLGFSSHQDDVALEGGGAFLLRVGGEEAEGKGTEHLKVAKPAWWPPSLQDVLEGPPQVTVTLGRHGGRHGLGESLS